MIASTASAEAEELRGARNLLTGCAGAVPGERLLILHEDASLGYYGDGLVDVFARAGRDIGLETSLLRVPFVAAVDTVPAEVSEALGRADHALFLARLGDQLRFRDLPHGAKPIVSYVLDRGMLASPFATAPHAAFVALKDAFNELFATARHIRVRCELGTDFGGRVAMPGAGALADVSIRRFPLSVFAPLDATQFSGRVAIAHFLAGTGSRYYQPYGLPLSAVIRAEIAGGRVTGWHGAPDVVARVRSHYDYVAGLFGIDRDFVHSWHAGIHPGCGYAMPAEASYERWSGGAFGNPRLLHFHTCGAYAPGEICWNIVDPTIEVDGRAVWRRGRIAIDAVPALAGIAARYPEVAALYDRPAQDIGLPALS